MSASEFQQRKSEDGHDRPLPCKVILASASPRRRDLLSMAGISFEVSVSDSEEITTEAEPGKIVEALSGQKARAVCNTLPEGERAVILGADTIVVLDGRVLGKPKDRGEAKAMITALQGKAHSVYTGVTLIRKDTGKIESFYSETRVSVRAMSEDEVDAYISTNEPYDKAGGYGVQGKFGAFIDRIEGDYATVVGLPLCRVCQKLKEMAGISIFQK